MATSLSLSFASPASTTLEELVGLRGAASALGRRVKRNSSAPQSGGSVSRRLGRGLDFAEVREYQPGDDVRQIDWKVTARTGAAHTKLFVEERERPVLLVVDFRANMRFGTQGMYKSVLAARLAALMGWCAVAASDRVGGFVFTNDWHEEIRPQSGRRGLMALLRAIDKGQKRVPKTGGEQLSKTLHRLRHSVPSGSTVVFFSDFLGFDDNAKRLLGSSLSTMDLIAAHITDPLDQNLPQPGNYPLSASGVEDSSALLLHVNSRKDQEQYLAQFKARQDALKSLLVQRQHTYLQISTHEPLLSSAANIMQRNHVSNVEGNV